MSKGKLSGLRAWVLQRISALYIAFFILFCLGTFTFSPITDYNQWRVWVGHPVINIFLAIFSFAVLFHAWIGIRDVLLDYIKPATIRLLSLCIVAAVLIALEVWMLRILFVQGLA